MKIIKSLIILVLLFINSNLFAFSTWEWAHLLWANTPSRNEVSTDKSGNTYLASTFSSNQISIDTQMFTAQKAK